MSQTISPAVQNERSLVPKLALILVFAAGFCSAQGQQQPAGRDIFVDVVVSNRFFKSSQSTPSLAVRTRRPARLDCLIFDVSNRVVAVKSIEATASQCLLALSQLPAAPKGLYTFCLVAGGPGGERLGLYPGSPGGGEAIQVRDAKLDAEKKTITYFLPRAACVRVRAGFQEGFYLQPLAPTTVQPAGRYTLAWDGACQGGLFTNLYQNPVAQVYVQALSLPDNILVDQGQSGEQSPQEATTGTPVVPQHLSDLAMPHWVATDSGTRKDFLMPEDYRLTIEVREDALKKIAEVRVACDSEDRLQLFNRRFELMLFVDGAFVAEDERSQMPYTYRMPTRGLAPGHHVVTANVLDSAGRLGTASQQFTVSEH